MLYHFLYPLAKYHTVFNVFQYITFRTIYAMLTSLVLSFIIGPYLIRKLKSLQVGEVIREDGPARHFSKAGTPTMGGAIILLVLLVSVLLCGNFGNEYLWIVLFVTIGFGGIGFVDDYKKVVERDPGGLRPLAKFTAQVAVAGAAAVLLYMGGMNTAVSIPFFKGVSIEMGVLYVPFAMLVIVGTSNAVNLTDGLDGLAIGPMTIAAATYMLFAYLSGHVKIANYLQITHVPYAGELTVFAGAMVGASLGFLWFNTYPAQVFMGDIGALSLGGGLGTLALLTKQEILLVVVGGIFVVEALSVIFQVASYKLSGRRVFAMAPIHHHFELKGWAEPKIIVRFWIIAIILSLIAISTLKLR
ncbi:MAG TPA: phospho-N-acetylmuramoyl-pentapeptide-transferase [Deltaproteobacteria bacterium]|nr:phospho-N-acetylmuramoyl-pentapeptide-transferase [Deltaproteobacteria bacterium]